MYRANVSASRPFSAAEMSRVALPPRSVGVASGAGTWPCGLAFSLGIEKLLLERRRLRGGARLDPSGGSRRADGLDVAPIGLAATPENRRASHQRVGPGPHAVGRSLRRHAPVYLQPDVARADHLSHQRDFV